VSGGVVLVLGSGPRATRAADWPRAPFTQIVAINNAWQVRPDWDFLIHPDDFPPAQQPAAQGPDQRIIRSDAYVPIQNTYGGFVYAGGTMSFTAGYWALGALKPRVLAYLGCDMVYPDTGPTHFYGTGTADPLRDDISLRNLEAKSARLMLLAAAQGCACVNLSDDESRLVFPRATLDSLAGQRPIAPPSFAAALAQEKRLGYIVPSGKYWKEESRFDPAAIDSLDQLWFSTLSAAP
jgi:hypothetical protein